MIPVSPNYSTPKFRKRKHRVLFPVSRSPRLVYQVWSRSPLSLCGNPVARFLA